MSSSVNLSWLLLLLLLAAAASFSYLLFKLRGPEDTLFVAALRVVCTVYSRLLHRLQVSCPQGDPVPSTGPFIIVANHRSGIDPLLLSMATRRRIRFLMAREYYEFPALHQMFRALGCIPVNRNGNDLGATKAALKALKNGQVIGIFPQGGIRDAEGSLEGKSGTALLALRTRAPIIPFYIEGSPNLDSVFRAFLTPSKSKLKCGSLMKFETSGREKPSREELEGVTKAILEAIKSLGSRPEPDPVPRMSG